MPLAAYQSPLGGNLGSYTACFYKLDPATFTFPLEPLPDLVPGIFTPLRVTLDIVDSESMTLTYDVTEHAVQSFLDVTTNVKKRLRGMTITGTFGGTPPLLPLIGGVPPVPGSFARLDILRLNTLQAIADAREPIMVVTPRHSMHRAIITSVSDSWGPADGEQMAVTVTLKEARLVSALIADSVAQDFPAQETANNADVGGGQSGTTEVTGPNTPPFSPTGPPA